MKKISDFETGDWEGPDNSLSISIQEYGIAWKKEEGGFVFIIGIHADDNCDYDRFTVMHMTEKDWESMVKEEWFDLHRVESFAGGPISFPSGVQVAISFWGSENIFGSVYHEGFEIDFE